MHLAVLILRRQQPMPHQGKGKAMDTAHDRNELCHFLENERKGKQIEYALAIVLNRLRRSISHIND